MRGVSLGGVSKAHGLPGLRVGWLASRDAAFNAEARQLERAWTHTAASDPASPQPRLRGQGHPDVAPRPVKVRRLKDFTTICPAAPSEVLATIALRSQSALLHANRRRLARGKEALRALVQRQSAHLQWAEPAAGPFAFVRLGGGVSAAAYCDALRARARLMLLPATCFEFGDERVRVTFGHDAMLERMVRWEADLQAHGVCLHPGLHTNAAEQLRNA